MYLLALRLAELRGTLSGPQLAEAIVELERLPQRVADMLEQRQEEVAAIAERHHDAEFFLYLGRHVGLPIALEGALKLKEISYVAADAYPAGEMKHGPIALLAPGTPVIAVATDSPVLDKALSNLQEVKARGAHVIAVAGDGNDEIAAHADDVIRVPAAHWMLAPLLAVIPLQLLAYHTARLRGLNVDQPRNLAKTVTVE
jgi:glucosamine--fructose-6-phosphate aminotransferase (isomerizing)